MRNPPERFLAIFGVPRSGTTWLGQLFNASPQVAYRYQPLFSYEFKDFLSESMRPEDVQSFHGQILQAQSEFVVPKHEFNKEVPTHLVWKSVRYHHLSSALLQNSTMKVIFLSRDPVSVLNSWYNAPREFLPAWDIHAEWKTASSKNRGRPEEFFGFEGWLQAQKIHRRNAELFPDRVQIVDYNTLCQRTTETLRELYAWAQLPWSAQVDDFIAASANRIAEDTYSTRKKPSAFSLPDDIVEEIERRTPPEYLR